MMDQPLIAEIYQKYKTSSGICTDTRKLTKGCLFIALKGGNFNGNQFALKALEAGAQWAIVDEVEYATDARCILVSNGLNCLQQLAQFHRQKFQIPFIGITGSNGKTTTKELLSAVLRKKFKVHVTPGNFNNHIGLPLTLLDMPDDTEIAILEMGANHIGENAELCNIFLPTHGLITSIGKEHLEGFGSIEGVVKANSELFDYLRKNNGIALVNLDDPYLGHMAARLPGSITYSLDETKHANYHLNLRQVNPTLELEMPHGHVMYSPLFGAYNASNILASCTVGNLFGVKETDMADAIGAYIPSNNRSQRLQTANNRVLLDCYNANPSSMELAVRNFAEAGYEKPVFILGDMFEMGDYEDVEHQNMIRMLETLQGDVFLAGKAFNRQAVPSRFQVFESTSELKAHLANMHLSGMDILLKASRGMKFEDLLEVL